MHGVLTCVLHVYMCMMECLCDIETQSLLIILVLQLQPDNQVICWQLIYPFPSPLPRQSMVTPLGALFWSIFSRDECAHLDLHPHGGSLTYFSIGGMVIMVPAIFLYNIG